jgi:hypothetical protein
MGNYLDRASVPNPAPPTCVVATDGNGRVIDSYCGFLKRDNLTPGEVERAFQTERQRFWKTPHDIQRCRVRSKIRVARNRDIAILDCEDITDDTVNDTVKKTREATSKSKWQGVDMSEKMPQNPS